jgi:hypothetical protein
MGTGKRQEGGKGIKGVKERMKMMNYNRHFTLLQI